jgi:hypothetical protein
MNEKEILKKEIESLKRDLNTYLKIFPLLGMSEKEKQRTIDRFLDDILIRQEKIRKLK